MTELTGTFLIGLAFGFAVVNGLNDGATMNAAALKAPGLRPLTSLVIVSAAVGVVPLVIGTAVAQTLRSGLVATQEESTTLVVAVGVMAAMVVAGALARRSLPTSLTLAVVGGIVGAGVGVGGVPQWGTVAKVIVIGLVAPVAGAAAAWVLVRAPVVRSGKTIGGAHVAATLTQAVAYAANDGQKMVAIAVVAVGLGPVSGGASIPGWLLAGLAVSFLVGSVLGLRSISVSLGGGVLPQRPRQEVAVQFGSGLAVLASAAFGTPVSMTQSITGGQIGVGLDQGYRQVRWRLAVRLVAAWVITLPAAAIVGGVVAGGVAAIVANGGR